MPPKTTIRCPWHQINEAVEFAPGVYECPECQRRRLKLSKLDDGEELEIEKPPEPARISKRQYVGSAKISFRPMDRAVLYWEACEDIRAGDTLVIVSVKDEAHPGDFTIRRACRPFRNPETDMHRLFGIALEDAFKSDEVPVQVLQFLPNEEEHNDWVELTNCELVQEVTDDE